MNKPIKTASQIIKEKGIDDKLEIDTSKPYPEGLRRVTREAMEEYAAQQVTQERERIKKLAKETRDEETNSIWIPQLFELIDNL